ncbi:MAG TPA: glycosyltransferase family 2 protein [Geothrix sp.]|jgi:hypothetical protein
MTLATHSPEFPPVKVGILVLNYHHPKETLDCIRSLLDREPGTSRIIWIENDSAHTWLEARALIEASRIPFMVLDPAVPTLPPEGVVGVILNEENLGFAGGNNAGLRLLHQLSVPFTWVLNNDTYLVEGNSELLVRAAQARPEIGLWGTSIAAEHGPGRSRLTHYMGGQIRMRDFNIVFVDAPEHIEKEPLTFVSGCSCFSRLSVLAEVGFIPEDFFLYYEDPALTFEVRKHGYGISGVTEVRVNHLESLSTGRGSPLMDYYNQRNRWVIIQRYFPGHMRKQVWRLLYSLQRSLFRGRMDRIRIDILAYLDFRRNRLGRSSHALSRLGTR